MMHSLNGERLLFLSNQGYLEPSGGGVQWCTREYLATLQAAGFEVLVHGYQPDRGLISRLSRKLRPRPFDRIVPKSVSRDVARQVIERQIGWIAFNNTEACVMAAPLRALVPECRQLFLSHGAEITDELNAIRLSPHSVPAHRRSARWLGDSLLAQVAHRQTIDASICISAEDVAFEHWLGARHVAYLPRQVETRQLKWQPQPGLVGTVATLDHAPNLHGIELLASFLGGSGVQLRLVGGPEVIGRSLQSTYPCIHYCGRLSDGALKAEVASWRAFINPIFCQARGASTKVATALGWGLPVLSTPLGVRGYIWDEGALPLSTTPKQLADLARYLALEADSTEWGERACSVVSRAPSLSDAADQVAAFLTDLP